MFGQNVTEHNPAPSPSGHPLLSGPPTLNDIHQIFTSGKNAGSRTKECADLGETAELRALTKALASVPCCEGRTAMAQPPAPHPDEQGRLDVLLALDVLDTTPEAHFEGLVKLGKYARVIAEHEI